MQNVQASVQLTQTAHYRNIEQFNRDFARRARQGWILLSGPNDRPYRSWFSFPFGFLMLKHKYSAVWGRTQTGDARSPSA